ncbi:MAG: hypothetical protein AAF211_17965 [Myxococcota bacterium]
MNGLRTWFARTNPLLLLAFLVGGIALATPAVAGPYRGGSHHRVERIAAERDAAYAEVDRLKRQLARSPTPGQWADAQARIRQLEQELVTLRHRGGNRLRGRIVELETQLAATENELHRTEARLAEESHRADRRGRKVRRLEAELSESRHRIARLERRLGYRVSRYDDRHRQRRNQRLIVDDD